MISLHPWSSCSHVSVIIIIYFLLYTCAVNSLNLLQMLYEQKTNIWRNSLSQAASVEQGQDSSLDWWSREQMHYGSRYNAFKLDFYWISSYFYPPLPPLFSPPSTLLPLLLGFYFSLLPYCKCAAHLEFRKYSFGNLQKKGHIVCIKIASISLDIQQHVTF